LEAFQSKVLAAKQEVESQFSIRQADVENRRSLILNNPEAGITFGDSTENAAKKVANYNTAQKVNSYVEKYGIAFTAEDMNNPELLYKKIEKAQDRDVIKQLNAAYPGVNIKSSAKLEDAYSAVRKFTKKEDVNKLYLTTFGSNGKGMTNKEKASKIASYFKEEIDFNKEKNKLTLDGLKKGLSGGNNLSSADIKIANENYIFNQLSQAERGDDDFIDPNVWRAALNEWQEAGMTASSFFEKYKGKVNNDEERVSGFINPKDL
jgi:hypothetical protein